MLADYIPGAFETPKKLRKVCLLVWRVTFSSGVATVDTLQSSPNVTCVKNATGIYDLTFPKGKFLQPVGIVVANTSGGIGNDAYLLAHSATAGTAQLEFDVNTAAATAADPADTCVAYITMLLGKA